MSAATSETRASLLRQTCGEIVGRSRVLGRRRKQEGGGDKERVSRELDWIFENSRFGEILAQRVAVSGHQDEMTQKHPLAQGREGRHICVLLGVTPQGGWPINSLNMTFMEGLIHLCFVQAQIWQVPVGERAWGEVRYTPASGLLHLLFPLPKMLFHRYSHRSFPHLPWVFSKMSLSSWCLPWPSRLKLQWHTTSPPPLKKKSLSLSSQACL